MKNPKLVAVIKKTIVIGIIANIVINILIPSDSIEILLWLYAFFPIAWLGVGYGFKFAGAQGHATSASIVTSPFMVLLVAFLFIGETNIDSTLGLQLAARTPGVAIIISVVLFECQLYKKFDI